MLKIGLTGGIGSGKTTVTNFFTTLGIPVIDADVITRELLTQNQEVFAKIFERYGQQALTTNNSINRSYLRQIIFNNKSERKWLENLLHPLVYQEIKKQIHAIKTPYCVISIPLLLESEGHTLVDRILVINTAVEKQIQRTMQRDNISATAVNMIMENQSDSIWRLSHADDIIDNNGSLENTQKQVLKLHEFYMRYLCHHNH